MSSKRTIILSMMISGTLAGLGGAVQGLGTFQNFFIQNTSLSIGFDGMAVSLLGAGSSIGILLSALLFGMLKLGGQGMPLIAGVPTELVDVVIAAIIFFVGISYLIRFLLAKASGSKKEVAIVETIEAAPDKNNQEGETSNGFSNNFLNHHANISVCNSAHLDSIRRNVLRTKWCG